MKVRFNRWYNAVLTTLLSMLGYSCSLTNDEPDMYGSILMYGVVNPDATYEVKGTVTDEGGTPVEGIKTAVKFVSPVIQVILTIRSPMHPVTTSCCILPKWKTAISN